MPRKDRKKPYPDVYVGCDISETLESLRLKIIAWQSQYGKNARIETDAGPNNVVIRVSPSKYPSDQ